MNSDTAQKVLIALDYNPTAQKVAETGFSMAKSMHAEITLLHVVSDPAYYSALVYSSIMGFNGFLQPDFLPAEGIKFIRKADEEFLGKSKNYLIKTFQH
jgi:nucleotide-binding universal stress UspA family protein